MTELPLTVVPVAPTAIRCPAASCGPAERERLTRQARALSWLSLAWMGVEGVVAISAGLLAGSVALLGFGADSAIEGIAAVIVIWRFSGERRLSDWAELRAQRLVAISFFLLAPFVAQDAIRSLLVGARPEVSWLGMTLTAGSLLAMPLLARAKRRVGTRLGSAATTGEGTQNLLCAYMAAGVLAGLLANTAFGFWWLDGVVALGIAGLAIREGAATWRGDGCCMEALGTAESCDQANCC